MKCKHAFGIKTLRVEVERGMPTEAAAGEIAHIYTLAVCCVPGSIWLKKFVNSI